MEGGDLAGDIAIVQANKGVNLRYPNYIQPYKTTINAYVSSLASLVVGFPLDSVKTRLQTYKYPSIWNCIVDTKRNEGFKGFYRGITAPLISSSVVRSFNVSVYSWAMSEILSSYSNPSILQTAAASFSAGSFAGLCSSVIACPFEFTKLSSQIEHLSQRRIMNENPNSSSNTAVKPRTLGTFQVARELTKKGGVLSLYSGFKYHVGSGVYFCVYDTLKTGGSGLIGSGSNHPLAVAVSGAMAGTVCWIVVYPMDTYKSMVQRDVLTHIISGTPLKPRAPLRSIMNRALYRGLGISIIRTSLIGMTFFSCYEQLMKHT